jgi:NTP pyrophosphatase (non-canonical NTP hydrolase)
MKKEGSLLLSDYAAEIADTDVLDSNDFNPILQGLYGEVGGIMATAKKSVREGTAYPGFKKAAEEEFGDTLWYLAAICRRLDISLEDIFSEAANHGHFRNVGAASDVADGALAYIAVPVDSATSLDDTLVCLGRSAAALLGNTPTRHDLKSKNNSLEASEYE